ncbi:MAG: hypothetical protein ACKOUM_12440, partial [Sphingopyxis sp.]
MISLRIIDPLIFPLVPADCRAAVNALWQLDEILAKIAVSGREPALRQIRMRWWCQQVAELGQGGRTPDEPVLTGLAQHCGAVLHSAAMNAYLAAWEDALASADDCGNNENIDAVARCGRALFALTHGLIGGMTSTAGQDFDADADGAAGGAWALAVAAQQAADGGQAAQAAPYWDRAVA